MKKKIGMTTLFTSYIAEFITSHSEKQLNSVFVHRKFSLLICAGSTLSNTHLLFLLTI